MGKSSDPEDFYPRPRGNSKIGLLKTKKKLQVTRGTGERRVRVVRLRTDPLGKHMKILQETLGQRVKKDANPSRGGVEFRLQGREIG